MTPKISRPESACIAETRYVSASEAIGVGTFMEEARESLGLLICCITNTIFMFIGFKKAKQPNYNFGFFFAQEPPQEN